MALVSKLLSKILTLVYILSLQHQHQDLGHHRPLVQRRHLVVCLEILRRVPLVEDCSVALVLQGQDLAVPQDFVSINAIVQISSLAAFHG